MNIREKLSLLVSISREIKEKNARIARMEALATNITVSNDGERVQTSSSKDRIGGFVAQIADLKTEVEALERKLDSLRAEILLIMNKKLHGKQYDVIYIRFFEDRSLEETAKEMDMTRRNVTRLQKAAIMKIL